MLDHQILVVVKYPQPPVSYEKMGEIEWTKRVAQEAHVSYQANRPHCHPNVLQFIGILEGGGSGVAGKTMGLMYQYLSGGTIAEEVLRERRYMSNKRSDVLVVMRMMRDAAKGLLHLHSKRIIHGDVGLHHFLLDESLGVR